MIRTSQFDKCRSCGVVIRHKPACPEAEGTGPGRIRRTVPPFEIEVPPYEIPPHSCMAAEQEIERLNAELDAYKAAREATYTVVEKL